MSRWNERLSTTGYALEKLFDALTARLRVRSGAGRKLQVLPYISYGNDERFFLKGRVLREKEPCLLEEENIWTAILATYRRINTYEVPFARVRATCGSESLETIADDEGFYSCEITNPGPGDLWREVQFEVLENSGKEPAGATGQVMVPEPEASFGVISDIDDTVIVSHAANLLCLAKTVFLQNARERIAFPGVAAFYRALTQPAPGNRNPIFYVSSGPWNLYDLVLDFFELNSIPRGPVFLQDYGFDRGKFLYRSHTEHKMEQITQIMNAYPKMPFVLIGDSGQHDPEVYSQVLTQTPNRIKAIYIRDVSGDVRDAQIVKLAQRVAEQGGDLRLVSDSTEAASHAVAAGLISASELPAIRGEVTKDILDANSDPAG